MCVYKLEVMNGNGDIKLRIGVLLGWRKRNEIREYYIGVLVLFLR